MKPKAQFGGPTVPSSGYHYQQPRFTVKTPHHFFKIILGDSLRDGKLKIPMKFSDKFGVAMPSSVELHAPCGTAWKIEVTKSNNEVWLQSGWREFSEHYSLSHGHLVVFRYEGDGQFLVIIFYGTASEIDYPLACSHNEASELREGDVEETGDDGSSFENLEISEWSCRKRKETDSSFENLEISEWSCRKQKETSPLACPKPSKSMRTNSTSEEVGDHRGGLFTEHPRNQKKEVRRRARPLTADEKSKALQMASSFKSHNPFFAVVMNPSYVNFASELNIPAGFVKKYFTTKSGEVILQVSDGCCWTVGYKVAVQCQRTYGKLDKKWKNFSRDNNLKVCDVCVFELIDRTKLLFRVVIYRKNDIPPCFETQVGANCSTKEVREGMSTTALEGLKSEANQNVQSPNPNEIALQRAAAFNSESPFFVVVMKPSYIVKRRLYIPVKFAERHLKRSRSRVHLRRMPASFFKEYINVGATWVTLETAGKSWPVKLLNCSGCFVLSAGWYVFASENSLQQGDICAFELIKRSDIVLKVSHLPKQY